MLNFSSLGAGAAAQNIADYYTNLAREDYYLKGGEPQGKWIGEGAEKFDFGGDKVDKADLYFAFAGYNPKFGNAIANNAGEKHKAGYDLTFSAPKSVSILWATANEKTRKAISEAQQKAVENAIKYAEKSGAFVQREGHAGAIKTPYKDGLAVATFEHSTSRNLDPHLHTHCIVCNLAENGKRIDFQSTYVKELGTVFRAELAQELQKLGLQIERDRFSFRVNVPENLEKELSSRRAEIEKKMDEKNAHTWKAAQTAVFATRQTKAEIDRAVLFQNAAEAAQKHRFSPAACYGKTALKWDQKDFLTDAFNHASTMTDTRLRAALMEAVQGVFDSNTALEKLREMEKSGELIRLHGTDGKPRYTSKEVYNLEKKLVEKAEILSQASWHGVSKNTLETVYACKTMAAEQQAAVKHITAPNRLAVVRGIAGAGKSYMLDGARQAWERAGLTVLGCAPSADAARGLQESAGIESATAHKMLSKIEFGQLSLSPKSVVVLDEAGMVGSRIMAKLVDKVEEAGAKLVLVGDTGQLQPVDAGAAMRSIQTRVGCQELTEIRRQHDEADRQIVRLLADGKAAEAVALMEQRGQIKQHDTPQQIREAVARAVVQDLVDGKSSLAMAGMNKEVRQINDLVHAKLQQKGLVKKEEERFETAFGERKFAVGERVMCRKNDYKSGLLNGQRCTILGVKENEIRVKLDGADKEKTIKSDEYNSLDYAYAVTVHKSQGATVDRAHYAVDPSMLDSNLGYVASSRHRESFALHCTYEDRANLGVLLARNREKDTAADYVVTEKNDQKPRFGDEQIKFVEQQVKEFQTLVAQQQAAREKLHTTIAAEQHKLTRKHGFSL